MGHLNNQDSTRVWYEDENGGLWQPTSPGLREYLASMHPGLGVSSGHIAAANPAPRPAMGATCSVYFIQEGLDGPIKIGKSVNPAARMREFQTHHAASLVLLAVTGSHSEAALHQRFATLRLRGEWFRAGPELVEFIQQLQAVAAW